MNSRCQSSSISRFQSLYPWSRSPRTAPDQRGDGPPIEQTAVHTRPGQQHVVHHGREADRAATQRSARRSPSSGAGRFPAAARRRTRASDALGLHSVQLPFGREAARRAPSPRDPETATGPPGCSPSTRCPSSPAGYGSTQAMSTAIAASTASRPGRPVKQFQETVPTGVRDAARMSPEQSRSLSAAEKNCVQRR